MSTIRSPLGALGALLVLLQGISAGALAVLRDQPTLQFILVITMVAIAAVVTGVVAFVVIRFALRNPGLLFNPGDIESSVHQYLYVSQPDKVTLSLSEPDSIISPKATEKSLSAAPDVSK